MNINYMYILLFPFFLSFYSYNFVIYLTSLFSCILSVLLYSFIWYSNQTRLLMISTDAVKTIVYEMDENNFSSCMDK